MMNTPMSKERFAQIQHFRREHVRKMITAAEEAALEAARFRAEAEEFRSALELIAKEQNGEPLHNANDMLFVAKKALQKL
jgi:hypothetical protein